MIPIRSFADAKTRLAGVLSPADRRRLAMAMAARVMRAARGLPVFVVSDDAEVLRWAERGGAAGLAPGVSGLNESITVAVDTHDGEWMMEFAPGIDVMLLHQFQDERVA